MRNALRVNLGLLLLLGFASGASKIARLPFEVAIFGAVGFSDKAIVIFGMTQIMGAIMLLVPSVRAHGGALMAATFAFSAFVIFSAGEYVIALLAILPVAMGCVVVATNRVPEAE